MRITTKVLVMAAASAAFISTAWVLQSHNSARLHENQLMLARLEQQWSSVDRDIADALEQLQVSTPTDAASGDEATLVKLRRSSGMGFAALRNLQRAALELARLEGDFSAHNREEDDDDGMVLARNFAARRAEFAAVLEQVSRAWDRYDDTAAAGSGNQAPAAERVRAAEPLGRSVAEVRLALRKIVDAEEAEIAEFDAEVSGLGWTLAACGLLLGAGLLALLYRDALRPLLKIERAVRSASGSGARPRLGYRRDDELGAVARAFDQMLDRLDATTVSREELERQVEVRTSELSLLSLVAAHTTNLVIITDAEGNIESVNASFERVTGYTLAEVRGRRPGSFLQGPGTDAATVSHIRARVQARQSVETEILNYTKSGSPYWLRLEIQPVRNAGGRVEHFIAVETDITERKRVAAELETYRNRLELALDASTTCTFDLDLAHNLVVLDTRWSTMLGGPPVETRLSPRRILEIAGPMDRRKALEHISECRLGRRQDYRIEYRVRDFLGRWKWIHSSGRVVERDEQGRGSRIIGTNTDITQRKLAELAGARQVELFGALSQITLDLLERRHLPDLLQALIVHAADLLEAPVGRLLLKEGDLLVVGAETPADASGSTRPIRRGDSQWVWLAHDSLRPAISAGAVRRTEEGRAAAEPAGPTAAFPLVVGDGCIGVLHLGRAGDGRDFEVAEVQLGVLFARLAALTVTNTRIYTDALAAAEMKTVALRESETRFRTLAEVSPVGIFSTDSLGQTNFVNRRWCEIAGLEPAESMGSRWIEAVHPEDRQALVQCWSEAIRAGSASSAEFRFLKPDGTVTHLVEHSRPQFDAAGALAGFVGTITDITSLRRAEEARRQSEAQLRHAQKMESLGTLAGGIAHDFNNILTGIFGFAELARLEVAPDHPALEWIENLSISANRARDLVQKILTFSRKHDGQAAPLRLQPVVHEALGLLRSSLPAMIELRHEIDPACPPVLAEGTQIHQIVMNLCTNSIHALPPANGFIEVRLATVELPAATGALPRGLTPGRHVLLAVRDNGHGMSPATIERIFEPFFTTKKAGHGTGLGLSMVHGIVQSYGGAIAVRSAPGAGTTFEIFLPALDSAVALPGETAKPAAPRGHNQRIMFVDDDAASRTSLARLIQMLGYQVEVFEDPREALARLEAAPAEFDLVATDLAMPELPGDLLAARVRAVCPGMPVVLITGYLDPERQPRLKESGVGAVLLKPPSIEELAGTLARLLPAEAERAGTSAAAVVPG